MNGRFASAPALALLLACSTRPAAGVDGADAGGRARPDAGPDAASARDAAADAPAHAPDAGTAASCAAPCAADRAGDVCAPSGCDLGALCVCDEGAWRCPACPPSGCPADAPADGDVCDPQVAASCTYPPPPAQRGVACRCEHEGDFGPSHWRCSDFESGCPLAPPASGSPCAAFNECAYTGDAWRVGCVCQAPARAAWFCGLGTAAAPADGAACAGVPRGVDEVVYVAPNRFAACACEGGADPRWRCVTRDCPAAEPSGNEPCVPYEGLNCTYPDLAGSCVCEDVSDLWQCG